MDLAQAVKLFGELRSQISQHRSYLAGNETVTRVLLIDRVLEILGWDVRDPNMVELEFEPAQSKNDKADYVLKSGSKNVAIVEAKRLGTQMDDLKHREQADGYARYAGVKYFVLTDGAKWGVYERDLMTSLEVLKPMVEFDLDTDDPTRCALNALSLWRDNLSSVSGPVAAKKPVLGPSVIVNGGGSSGGGQGTSDPTGKGWLKLSAEINVRPRAPKPNEVMFPDGSVAEIKTWVDLYVEIAEWVVKQPSFSEKYPKPIAEIRFGNSKPMAIKSSGEDFIHPYELSNGCWIERNVNPSYIVLTSRALLEHCGFDTGSIRVRFEDS